MCIPCGPAYHFIEFQSVFHPCFIRGSRISFFTAFRDECSTGGEGASLSKNSPFPQQPHRSVVPGCASIRQLIASLFLTVHRRSAQRRPRGRDGSAEKGQSVVAPPHPAAASPAFPRCHAAWPAQHGVPSPVRG